MSIRTENGNILKFIQVDFLAINHELRYMPNKLLRTVYLNFFLYYMDEGILLDDSAVEASYKRVYKARSLKRSTKPLQTSRHCATCIQPRFNRMMRN